jgi:hypothetical protein
VVLHSILRLFAIAFERPFIELFDSPEYQCLVIFCYHRGECHHSNTSALDAKKATIEELRYYLKEEHPAGSPLIVVTTDGKGPANKVTHYQA